jgi:hypothetical protein
MMTLEDCRAFYSQEIRLAANLTTPGLVEAFAHVPRDRAFHQKMAGQLSPTITIPPGFRSSRRLKSSLV